MNAGQERREAERIDALLDTRAIALRIVSKLLKAQQGAIAISEIVEEFGIQREYIERTLAHLQEENMVTWTDDHSAITVPSGEERLRLAVMAVTLGGTIEESAVVLSWKEFETFCINALDRNGYVCIHGFRFKSTRGRRYECDVVGLDKPMILLVDCKHYGGKVTRLRMVVKKQLERVGALARSIPAMIRKIPQISGWREAIIIPVIVTLLPESLAIIDGVPIVPVFKLNEFIHELPSNIERVTNILVKPSRQGKLL